MSNQIVRNAEYSEQLVKLLRRLGSKIDSKNVIFTEEELIMLDMFPDPELKKILLSEKVKTMSAELLSVISESD